jgi:hypothetical protein
VNKSTPVILIPQSHEKDLRRFVRSTEIRETAGMLRGVYTERAMQVLRFALLKITPCASFPRKRESTGLGPRFRGGDKGGDFHFLGWAAGP